MRLPSDVKVRGLGTWTRPIINPPAPFTCGPYYSFGWLTADREERVGLLARHRGHTFQRVEPSPADVDPTLHLCLAKHGAEQSDGDDIVLFLGGIHLLGTPEGRRLDAVDKGLSVGSWSYSSVVPRQDTLQSLH